MENQEQLHQRNCKRCGRKLKTAESIQVGMGSTCYKRYLEEQKAQPHFKFMDKFNI
jgi:hypothetical protein